jgi:hypothetical protein
VPGLNVASLAFLERERNIPDMISGGGGSERVENQEKCGREPDGGRKAGELKVDGNSGGIHRFEQGEFESAASGSNHYR